MSYARRDNFGPKPVEVGKEYDVQITETSRKGDGIARVQGFVIFVKDGKVGQKAKIRITNVGERFANAELVASGTSSSQQSDKSNDLTPPVAADEKSNLQDYQSDPKEEISPEELPKK